MLNVIHWLEQINDYLFFKFTVSVSDCTLLGLSVTFYTSFPVFLWPYSFLGFLLFSDHFYFPLSASFLLLTLKYWPSWYCSCYFSLFTLHTFLGKLIHIQAFNSHPQDENSHTCIYSSWLLLLSSKWSSQPGFQQIFFCLFKLLYILEAPSYNCLPSTPTPIRNLGVTLNFFVLLLASCI